MTPLVLKVQKMHEWWKMKNSPLISVKATFLDISQVRLFEENERRGNAWSRYFFSTWSVICSEPSDELFGSVWKRSLFTSQFLQIIAFYPCGDDFWVTHSMYLCSWQKKALDGQHLTAIMICYFPVKGQAERGRERSYDQVHKQRDRDEVVHLYKGQKEK